MEQKKDKEDVGGRGENDGESEDEGVYLMGVPGIWQHREQYMAAMFGFRKFQIWMGSEKRIISASDKLPNSTIFM